MASPVNSTHSNEEWSSAYSPLHTAILVTFVTVTGLWMLVGYLWVILTVARTPTLHTASNYFLASLSVAEIFMGVLGQPSIISIINIHIFSRSSYFFSVWVVSFCFVGYFLNAVLLAFDKWFKISRPFVYVRVMTRVKCAVCLAVVWGLCTLGSLVCTVAHTYWSDISLDNRELVFHYLIKVTLLYFYVFILPSLVVITAFNILILRIARHQARAVAANLPAPPRHLNPGDPNIIPGIDHRKSTRQFSIFLFAFLLAWFPMGILLNAIGFTGALSNTPTNVAFLTYTAIAVGQAAFGTFILTVLQPDFRQILKQNLRDLGKKLRCFPCGSQ